jgi:GH15 family glucan-1,4-alpha-glucosidase
VVPVDAVVPWARPADAAGVLLERADEAEQHIGRARLPRHHPGRAGDALAVMRACTDRHTGAIVAAPTTSLPEAVGHDRQFDYRYCWIRDAALATSVAVALGQPAAAGRYVSFVADVVLPNPDEAAPVVGTHGDPVPNEREVSGVCGWGGSVPVRVGNAAADQVQYDAWGFVLEALLVQLQAGGSLNRDTWRLVRTVADRMAENEPGPESGIWELRDEKRLLSADIGRWLALDRAVRIARTRRPWHRRSPWARARDEARRTVLDAMHDDGRLPQAHDDSRPDASALMAVLFGLVAPDDQRAHHLVDAVLRDLAEGAYVRRYPPDDDGFSGVEGTFLPLSWWVVSCLAILGRLEEADARTDELCAGLPQLLPEMVDPLTGAALGNTPLVWSHVELARALVCLDMAHRMRWIDPLGVVVLRFLRSLPRRLCPQQ